ncbi:MAG: eukaryotic-like serine/threonine-protein kinase [Hyphomicrobiales bacterium]|jgi:serine/threonine-protein kinase|nr:eukaryotic-like serine/threonine-protein kinase [Hyphomicrobiales bacterium]
MLHCPTCGRHYSADFEVCPEDQSPLQADATIAGLAPVDPLVGHTLDDKYRLEEKLGVGGMGTVYRARHLLIDRPVAVKVLNQRFVEDEAARTRFRREARAAGRLQHTNAVTVTDFGESHDGYVYLVMELLEGRTLREVLAKEAPLDPARSVSLMMQISAAVAAAHEAGIIHRDLKPANIFIVQRAEVPAVVKVLDFGIAKLAAESLDEDEPLTLTQIGAMIGTPRYMSPEQCDGAELTPAADVYSLGVILYEMLTGTVPFSGSTPLAIAMKHTSEAPRNPREFVSTIPPALEQIVLHALEKRPPDRPANAAEFRKELVETAERLGLEHAALASSPNLAALRNVGTESPSGRLVIDISRLRENRAAGSDVSEVTLVGSAATLRRNDGNGPLPVAATASKFSFPRVSVSMTGTARSKKQFMVIAAIVVVLLIGITLAVRSRNAAAPTDAIVGASPSPTVEPSPSPSPVASPKPEVRRPVAAKPKKESKTHSFVNKVKRIFKNPF